MEITVLKCDRCKKEVEGLIEYSFVNRNIQEDKEEEKTDSLDSLTARLWGKTKQYPTVRGGLCLECTQEISWWLGHQENELKVEGIK